MRLIGRRTASIRLTVAQVRDLFVTPVEVVPAPGLGIVLVPAAILFRKTAGAIPGEGSINVGSNGNVAGAVRVSFLELTADKSITWFPVSGTTPIGSAAEAGSIFYNAVENSPLVISADVDLSEVDFAIDVDIEIVEIPFL